MTLDKLIITRISNYLSQYRIYFISEDECNTHLKELTKNLSQEEKRYLCHAFQPLLCSIIFDTQIEYLQVTEEVEFITKG